MPEGRLIAKRFMLKDGVQCDCLLTLLVQLIK